MFCTKCGRELKAEERFCKACGAQVKVTEKESLPIVESGSISVPADLKKKGKVKIPAMILVLILAIVTAWFVWTKISVQPSRTEDIDSPREEQSSHTEGFDSPQEALDYFVKAVSEMNYEKALTAFPIEKAAENYHFYDNIERIGAWNPNLSMPIPGNSDANIWLNQNFFRRYIERQIDTFIFSFFAEPELLEGITIVGEDEIQELLRDYDVEKIIELRIKQMEFADPEFQFSERNQENYERMTKTYGGDTLEDYRVEYQIGDKVYIGGAQFIRYGETYYIWNLSSNFVTSSVASPYYVFPEGEDWEPAEEDPEAPASKEEPAETQEMPAAAIDNWLKVGWIVQDMADESQSYLCRVAGELAEEMEIMLVFLDQEGDVQNGVTQIQSLIADGAYAIIIDPCDRQAVTPYLQEAWDSGIPVGIFSFDLAKDSQTIDSVAEKTLEYVFGILTGDVVEENDWLFSFNPYQ